jgi:hypothetical protein
MLLLLNVSIVPKAREFIVWQSKLLGAWRCNRPSVGAGDWLAAGVSGPRALLLVGSRPSRNAKLTISSAAELFAAARCASDAWSTFFHSDG